MDGDPTRAWTTLAAVFLALPAAGAAVGGRRRKAGAGAFWGAVVGLAAPAVFLLLAALAGLRPR